MAEYTRQQYIDGLNRAYEAGDIEVVNELGEVLARMDAEAAAQAPELTKEQYINGFKRAYDAGDMEAAAQFSNVLTRIDAQEAQDAEMAELIAAVEVANAKKVEEQLVIGSFVVFVIVIIGAAIWASTRKKKNKGDALATSVHKRSESKMTDDASLYEKYTAEFESGDTDKAVMAKAMAIHGGDREKAKYEYVRLKVEGEKVADTSLENGNEGGQALSHTESFFNGGQGWLVALSPCVIGAVIFSISQGGADQTFSFLFGQIIGSTFASALPGLFIGGLYILIKRPQIGGDVILKKCIFWSAVAMTAFVVIGIQAN
jgi:hypothetical protein